MRRAAPPDMSVPPFGTLIKSGYVVVLAIVTSDLEGCSVFMTFKIACIKAGPVTMAKASIEYVDGGEAP